MQDVTGDIQTSNTFVLSSMSQAGKTEGVVPHHPNSQSLHHMQRKLCVALLVVLWIEQEASDMPCSSDCPCQESWALFTGEQGCVPCVNPAKYLVMPGVQPSAWLKQKWWEGHGQEEDHLFIGHEMHWYLDYVQLCLWSQAKTVWRGIAFVLKHC